MLSQPDVTAGIDLGDRRSHVCLIDTRSGEVVEESRVPTTPKGFERRFSGCRPVRIAIEAGTHSPWVSRLLEACGHEVLVANARKLELIYGGGRKNDRLDAENLARLARLDPRLLSPIEHRGKAAQAHLAIVRSREALVGTRTKLVNHVRGAVKSFGARPNLAINSRFCRTLGDSRKSGPESVTRARAEGRQAVATCCYHAAIGLSSGHPDSFRTAFTKKSTEPNSPARACRRAGS